MLKALDAIDTAHRWRADTAPIEKDILNELNAMSALLEEELEHGDNQAYDTAAYLVNDLELDLLKAVRECNTIDLGRPEPIHTQIAEALEKYVELIGSLHNRLRGGLCDLVDLFRQMQETSTIEYEGVETFCHAYEAALDKMTDLILITKDMATVARWES